MLAFRLYVPSMMRRPLPLDLAACAPCIAILAHAALLAGRVTLKE